MRAFVICGLIGALCLGQAAPAMAKEVPSGERVVISGPVEVAENQTATDVVVLHGSVNIRGRVTGDLFIFDGPAQISGVIEKDVVALGGPVTLGPAAVIKGDLIHRGTLNASPGSSIRGETRQARAQDLGDGAELFGRIAVWAAVSISTFLLGLILLLIAPRVSETIPGLARSNAARTLGWGLLLFFALPVLAVVCFLTVVGIPLGFIVLFGLLVLYPLSYAISAVVLGRTLMSSGGRIITFLAGLAVLRLVALLPFLGGLTSFAATLFGLGAIGVALRSLRADPSDSAVVEGSPTGPPLTLS
ncbi:MAG: hypothetical protein ACR2FO_00595 [Actinomycetota bacterium]